MIQTGRLRLVTVAFVVLCALKFVDYHSQRKTARGDPSVVQAKEVEQRIEFPFWSMVEQANGNL